MSALGEDLRGRSDADLARLLAERPDLTWPEPSSIGALATRAATRPSVERALAGLNRFELDAAETLVVLAEAGAVSVAAVSRAMGSDAGDALATLRRLALVTGGPDDLRPVGTLVEALGPYPAGLGPSLASLDAAARGAAVVAGAPSATPWTPSSARPSAGSQPPTHRPPSAGRPPAGPPAPGELEAALAEAPEGALRVLDALRWGPPLGAVDPASPGPGTTWLLDRGLLVRVSPTQVVLPREVGMALRDQRTHRGDNRLPPLPATAAPAPAAVAAEAAQAAQEAVRRIEALLGLWEATPPTTLREGGIGARELRRLGGALDTETAQAAFLLELASASGLVGEWGGGEEPTWLPTVEAERWLTRDTPVRWAGLVRSWLASPRAAWLVGTRTEKGQLRAALARGLERPWVPGLRRTVLTGIAAWPAGSAPAAEQLYDYLAWRTPRACPPQAAVSALLAAIAWLGLTGAGALSNAGRTLLDEVPAAQRDGDAAGAGSGPAGMPTPSAAGAGSPDPVAAALEADLPPVTDEILIQGDLTGVVPGRPGGELADLIESAAEVESRGSALTVRFTAASVRRALDRGLSGESLLESLRAHSTLPLPQPLTYLVTDLARKHAGLRIGVAACYLRSDDTGTLAAIAADPGLASLGLRLIAPTVAVSSEPAARVLDLLRAHELSAVVEGPDGAVIADPGSLGRMGGALGAGRPHGQQPGRRRAGARPATADLPGIVARMRDGEERAGAMGAAATPARVLETLRDAAEGGTEVLVELVGATGTIDRRRLRPLSLEAGRLRALDTARQSEFTIAVHRIAGVGTQASGS